MGNRIHIITKHVVEYGNSGLNWQMDSLKKLLNDNGCNVNGELNDDAVGDWEIEEEQFQKAVETIKRLPDADIENYFREPFTAEEVRTLLQEFLDTGDHSDGYYHFSWF